ASAIEIDAPLLELKCDQRFVYVADDLVRDEQFLVLGFFFLNTCFRPLALVAIVYRQRYTNAEGVIARASWHLSNTASQIDVGNALRVLQTNRGFGGGCAESRGLQIRPSRHRFIA